MVQAKKLPPRVVRFLSETEALALRIQAHLSISVVGMIYNLIEGVPNYRVIEEFNTFGGGKKTKFPSGHVTRADTNSITALCRELVEEIWIIPKKVRFCTAAEFTSTDSSKHFKFFFIIEESIPLPEEVKAAVIAKTIELEFDTTTGEDNEGTYYEANYFIRPYRKRTEEANKDLTVNAYDTPINGIENVILQGQFLGLAKSIPMIQKKGPTEAMALLNYRPYKLHDFFVED